MTQKLHQFFLNSCLVMLGWNLSLALALIVIIFLSIILQSLGVKVSYTSIAFILSAVVAGALGLMIGVQMGKNARDWFVARNFAYLIVLWMMLLGVTFIMFPSHYNQMLFDMIS